MKKLLFTLALIFALLVSCEKWECEEPHYFIGEWTTDIAAPIHFSFEIIKIDTILNYIVWSKYVDYSYPEDFFEYNINYFSKREFKYVYKGVYDKQLDLFQGRIHRIHYRQEDIIADNEWPSKTTRGFDKNGINCHY